MREFTPWRSRNHLSLVNDRGRLLFYFFCSYIIVTFLFLAFERECMRCPNYPFSIGRSHREFFMWSSHIVPMTGMRNFVYYFNFLIFLFLLCKIPVAIAFSVASRLMYLRKVLLFHLPPRAGFLWGCRS